MHKKQASTQHDFKVFVDLECARIQAKLRDQTIRCIVELQDQSKNILIPYSHSTLFWLPHLEAAEIRLRFIHEKTSRLLGQATCSIPEDVHRQSQVTISDVFQLKSYALVLDGRYEVRVVNAKLQALEREEALGQDSRYSSNLQDSKARNGHSIPSQRVQTEHSTVKSEINKSVDKILLSEDETSTYRFKTQCDTYFTEESPTKPSGANKSGILDSSYLHLTESGNTSEDPALQIDQLKRVIYEQRNLIQALRNELNEQKDAKDDLGKLQQIMLEQTKELAEQKDASKQFELDLMNSNNQLKQQVKKLKQEDFYRNQKLIELQFEYKQIRRKNELQVQKIEYLTKKLRRLMFKEEEETETSLIQKERYEPAEDDKIDLAVSRFINQQEQVDYLKKIVLRKEEGRYLVATKKVQMKWHNEKVWVKEQGKWSEIEQYFKQNNLLPQRVSKLSLTPKRRN